MTGFVIKSICNQFELSWWTISGAKQWEFIESEASLIRNWEPEGKIIAKYFSEWVQHYDFHDKIMQKHNLGQSGIVAFSHFSWLIFRDNFITNLFAHDTNILHFSLYRYVELITRQPKLFHANSQIEYPQLSERIDSVFAIFHFVGQFMSDWKLLRLVGTKE